VAGLYGLVCNDRDDTQVEFVVLVVVGLVVVVNVNVDAGTISH
jgi:hypothetical protein